MPELDLQTRLGAARAELLTRIHAPELAEIRQRASRLRRRRTAGRAGAAALGLLLIASLAYLVGPAAVDRPTPRPPVAATPTPTLVQPEWRGSGLTLLGLTADVSDLPGDLYDVQFADNERGYALLADCAKTSCELTFATTADSGLTWTRRTLPVTEVPVGSLPQLVPLGPDTIALLGAIGWVSHDDGRSWVPAPAASGGSTAAVGGDGRLALGAGGGSGGCSARKVNALGTDGSRRPLVEQPPLDVCWIAPTRAADRSWWVGGAVDPHSPAAAVSRDGGLSWRQFTFSGPDRSWTKVVPFGSEVYVVVVTGEPGAGSVAVHALYRSTDQGHTFARYGDPAGMATLAGDLVPLLDGRLVAAAPGWRISAPDGTNFRDGSPELPRVGRLQRTDAGWVAYDLFSAGWAAFSTDGAIWRKIHIR